MLMPKRDRVLIYENLFKEGVMVAKKDFNIRHPEIEVQNLHVIKAMQSLKSRGLVSEQFAWRHYYWYLSNEGIQYLRDYLHLPAEIVPATLKRQTRPSDAGGRPPRGPPRGDRDGGPPGKDMPSDRAAYRRGPPGGDRDGGPPGDKKGDVGPGTGRMEFRGGFGRGRGRGAPGGDE